MNSRTTTMMAALVIWLLPLAAPAQEAASVPLRYKFTPGQTLRYLIQCDPYFVNPAAAIETTDPQAPFRPPLVERLTERVLAVGPAGVAIIKVTMGPEPGFEDAAHPIQPATQTVTVTPRGEVLTTSPPSLAPLPEFLRLFFRLPDAPVHPGASWPGEALRGTQTVPSSLTLTTAPGGSRGLAIITQTLPPLTTEGRSPSHDGTLLQTTHSAQSDRIVFDVAAGSLRRQTSTLTATLSLVMTERGPRGSADFGRVIPNVETVQTLTIDRRDDLPAVPGPPVSFARPLRASAAPRTKR